MVPPTKTYGQVHMVKESELVAPRARKREPCHASKKDQKKSSACGGDTSLEGTLEEDEKRYVNRTR